MTAPDKALALEPRAARRRRSRGRLVVLLVLFLLLAGELVVRVFGLVDVSIGARTPQQAAFNAANVFVAVDDAAVSFRNRPDVRVTVAGVEYAHDARGARVLPPPPNPPPGARPAEVAFLGDSTCYGLGLPAAESLPALVQSALGGLVRARNLGVCGYTTSQEVALYEAERKELGDTRLVVLLVFPNDFAPGAFLWDEGLCVMYQDPLPVPRAWKPALWRSALYRALVSWRGSAAHAAGEFDPLRPESWGPALAAVEHLAADVRADGRALLVAHLPAMEGLDPYEFAAPVEQLRATCERLGVAYVDLLQPFLAERERQAAAYEARSGQKVTPEQRAGFLAQYWIVDPADHHLNAAANRIAAGALSEAVRRALGP
ncbi:MAG TPA: hypothetical protein VFY71_03940 [Planctomycetota bacterium]|nr:hypothetical protein [Planctomycetota bacterium]